MVIVEYKLDRGPSGRLITPSWLASGGQFHDPDDYTLVGVVEDPPRRHKVPDAVKRLSQAEARARAVALHARHPFLDSDANPLTAEQVGDMVDAWVGFVVT